MEVHRHTPAIAGKPACDCRADAARATRDKDATAHGPRLGPSTRGRATVWQSVRMAHGTSDEPTHLNNHHLNTLTAIFSHPTSHNIRWADTISLLEHVGEVEERHDGKFKITLGAETEIFERPQSKDIGTQMVVDLRRMLRNAGFDPKKPGEEV